MGVGGFAEGGSSCCVRHKDYGWCGVGRAEGRGARGGVGMQGCMSSRLAAVCQGSTCSTACCMLTVNALKQHACSSDMHFNQAACKIVVHTKFARMPR